MQANRKNNNLMKTSSSQNLHGLLVIAASVILHLAAFGQGALTPSGAPAPTMKTLDQIEPRTVITNLPWTISSPGSYVVTRNLSLASGNGISVTASDVTIDLNGFVLTGTAGGGGHGIHVATGLENVTLQNGVLRNWGADGVHARGTDNVRIDKLRVHGCAGDGIEMSRGTVSGIVSSGNSGAGLRPKNDPIPGIDIIVEKKPSGPAKLANNGGGGVVAEGPGSIQLDGGDISGNTGHGISWVSAEAGATFRLSLAGVACDDNTADGVHLDLSGTAARVFMKIADVPGEKESRASGNGGNGISVAASAEGGYMKIDTIEGEFTGNGGNGVTVTANAVDYFLQIKGQKGSYVNNGGHGMYVEGGTKGAIELDASTFSGNTGAGLRLRQTQQSSFGTLVRKGFANNNGAGGIVMEGFGSLRVSGTVSGNTGHGISCESTLAGSFFDIYVGFENLLVQSNTGSGIHIASTQTGRAGITLNGATIRDNGGHGIEVDAPAVDFLMEIEGPKGDLVNNGGDGLHVNVPGAGARGILKLGQISGESLRANDNGGHGVSVVLNAADSYLKLGDIKGEFVNNAGHGMSVQGGNQGAIDLDGSDFSGNTQAGLIVIADNGVKPGSVNRVNASHNGSHAIQLQGSGAYRFSGCRAAKNGGDGIRAERPAAGADRWGELIFETNDLVGNTGAGLNVPTNATATVAGTVLVTGGLVSGNTAAGIIIADNGVKPGSVNRVSITGNGGHGLMVAGHDFAIADNLISRNAGSGIRVTGTGAHLTRNQCSANVTGIEVTGLGNAVRENVFGGTAAQTPLNVTTPGNGVAPTQDVDTGTNPLGNVGY